MVQKSFNMVTFSINYLEWIPDHSSVMVLDTPCLAEIQKQITHHLIHFWLKENTVDITETMVTEKEGRHTKEQSWSWGHQSDAGDNV